MGGVMKELCVVHLVRASNGIDTLARFLESYQANPGGIEHDLLIVFKGFEGSHDAARHEELLSPFRHATLFVSDEGFDITAYQAAVRHWSGRYRYFCFLNSYSEILDPDWLKKLHDQVVLPGVGIAGATGSWNSHWSNAVVWLRSKGSEAVQLAGRPFRALAEAPAPSRQAQDHRRMVLEEFERAWNAFQFLARVGPFPNYHVRTNAFVISGELMASHAGWPVKTKMDAYLFESGRKGLTRRTLQEQKRVIVVGRDGRGYEKEEWGESRTFWQARQENLLVADNQTRDYENGTPERRRYLSSIAWGEAGRAPHSR
jgi:hypothetical protein